MSILTGNANIQPAAPVRASRQIIQRTVALSNHLIREWEHAFDALWNNPQATPEEVLSELGTNAAELFALNTAIVGLLQATLPTTLPDVWARIGAKVAAMPATTIHPDGTVTIDEP